jgi:hypothetical protein
MSNYEYITLNNGKRVQAMALVDANGNQVVPGLISGSVTDYASLPDAASNVGSIWFVENGSGGYLTWMNVYKYPRGLYSPNASLVWELIPFNVKIAEDSFTLVNITNWSEWISYSFDIGIGDRLIYNDKEYKNITGAQTSTTPDTDTTNWELTCPTNILRVCANGCEFKSIKAAIDSITDNSVTNRYTILADGRFVEDNPIQCKEYVNIKSMGVSSGVTVLAQNPSEDLFTLAPNMQIENMVVYGVTGVGKAAMNMSVAGEIGITNIIVADCYYGLLLNHASAIANTSSIIGVTQIGTVNKLLYNLAGDLTTDNVQVSGQSTIGTIIESSGSNCVTTIHNVLSKSSNVTTGIKLGDGSRTSGGFINLVSVTDGMVVDGNSTNVNLNVLNVFNAQNDGVRINDVGSDIRVNITGAIEGSTNYDINYLSSSCILTGSIFTSIDNINFVAGAQLYGTITDIKEDDEGFNVIGELHVGLPEQGAESAMGGGDSYTRGMLVYTENTSNVFVDISVDARSPSGSTFTFTGTAANNSIYIASSLANISDYLLHHGIKMSITTAGVLGTGNIIAEYWNGSAWVEINSMVSDSDKPFLPYGKDYFSRTGGFQLRYDIVRMNDGTWTKNDPIIPALGTDYYWIRFRVTSAITTAPIFQQFKLHPPRTEVNSDGFIEWLGDARPYAQLPISVGTGKPFEGNMQNQTLYMDENIGVGYTTNRFTATGDKYGWDIIAPNNIDTSAKLAFRFCGRPTVSETITWTVRWTWQNPDGTIYTSEPASGSNPNSQSDTVSKAVTLGTLEWFQIYLDISNLIARRDTNFPDMMMISIQPSTMGGSFDLMGVQAYYLIWSPGGHAD